MVVASCSSRCLSHAFTYPHPQRRHHIGFSLSGGQVESAESKPILGSGGFAFVGSVQRALTKARNSILAAWFVNRAGSQFLAKVNLVSGLFEIWLPANSWRYERHQRFMFNAPLKLAIFCIFVTKITVCIQSLKRKITLLHWWPFMD